MVKWMKNKPYTQNRSKDTDPLLNTSVIGMYEMLAQAQPDLNYDHSYLLDEILNNLEVPEVSNE